MKKRNLIIILLITILLTGCNKKEKIIVDEMSSEKETTSTNATTTTTNIPSTTSTTEVATTSHVTTTSKVATTTSNVTTKKITTTSKPTTPTTSKATSTKPTSKVTTTTVVTTTTTTSPTTTTTQKILTESEVYQSIMSLQSKYPTGTPWDNSNYYGWKAGIYSGGYGCAGFAFMLSDNAFGSKKATKHTNFDSIKVGDVVRYLNDTHSVIILKRNGETFTVAEGNLNSAVYWGREITLSEFKNSGSYVLTRW